MKTSISRKMTCIEPSPLIPLQDDDVTPLKASAADLLKWPDFKYDALLIMQALHNIVTEVPARLLFEGVSKQLKPNGRIGIMNRPEGYFPWSKSMQEVYNGKNTYEIDEALVQAGFVNIQVFYPL